MGTGAHLIFRQDDKTNHQKRQQRKDRKRRANGAMAKSKTTHFLMTKWCEFERKRCHFVLSKRQADPGDFPGGGRSEEQHQAESVCFCQFALSLWELGFIILTPVSWLERKSKLFIITLHREDTHTLIESSNMTYQKPYQIQFPQLT